MVSHNWKNGFWGQRNWKACLQVKAENGEVPPEENGEANGEANGKANGEELSEKSKSEQKTEQFQEVQTTNPSNSGLTFQPSERTLEKHVFPLGIVIQRQITPLGSNYSSRISLWWKTIIKKPIPYQAPTSFGWGQDLS